MFIVVTTADAADHGTTCFKKSSQFFLHFICEGKTQHITFITCKIQEKSYNNMRNISFVREKTTKYKTFYYSYLKFSLVFFLIYIDLLDLDGSCSGELQFQFFLSHHPIFSKIEKKGDRHHKCNYTLGYDINHDIKPNLTM